MPVRERAYLRGAQIDRSRIAVEHDEVVARAMHLGEFKFHAAIVSDAQPLLVAARTPLEAARSVEPGLARRTGLEALVHPVILFGNGRNLLFEERVHAARVGLVVAGRVVVPRLEDAQLLALV